MNLKAAKQLLKNIQEKDALDSCNNFLAAKTQLEYTEAAKPTRSTWPQITVHWISKQLS